jgi:hypothetical protein
MDANGDAFAIWLRDQGSGMSAVESSFRPAGGSFPATGTVLSSVSATQSALAVDAQGNASALWTRYDSSGTPTYKVEGAVRPAGGSFGTATVLESQPASTDTERTPQVAVDGQGNGIAVWTDFRQTTESVLAAGYDGAGPQLRSLSVPATGTAGQAVSDSVSPFDVWSSVPSTTWNFGDGSTASGTSVSHTYAAAGNFNVTVTSTDAVGNSSTATRAVTIAAAPPGPPGTKVPVMSSVSMTNRVFVVGPEPTALLAAATKPRGTVFKYTLSTAATVRIQIQRPAPGRKSRGRCVKPTKKLRKKPRCTRYVGVGTLTRNGSAGPNTVRFSGRIGRKALTPGKYVAVVTATNSAGSSQPAQLKFQIVRAKPKPKKRALSLF